MKKINKTIVIYYLRWIFSALVMYPVMGILQKLNLSLFFNLIIGQIFGATLFWNIDKRIFKYKEAIDEGRDTKS